LRPLCQEEGWGAEELKYTLTLENVSKATAKEKEKKKPAKKTTTPQKI